MSYIIRVDDRLVHGQVIEGWIKPLKISMITICSDTIACDIMQKTLYKLSVPPHVALECDNIETVAKKIVEKKYEKENVLILISSLQELNVLVNNVLRFSEKTLLNTINIGGLRHCGNKKQVYRALCLDMKDIELLKELISKKIVMEYYILPDDKKLKLNDLVLDLEKTVKNEANK